MVFWIACAAGLAVGYLLGSIPTGYLAGKLLRGVDIREQGSGSTGATNVLRTLGKWPALAVLVVDVLKGAAAVLFARWFYPWLADAAAVPAGLDAAVWTPWAVCLTGLAALVGHARPVWLNFAGGKSVAAGLGLLLALAWPAGVGGLAVFALTVAIFRFVSLGSILAAATAVALVWVLNEPLAYRLLVTAGGLYVVARHRANIQRLIAGAEPRLGQRLEPQG
ncbi:glycerol-3-phosphate 1-O-acyltransferase PlsY [Phenylobacterium sp.]|uniref:glycerol-3-phosphate 1-O-acyltransferase PlsY n=1 Tax=Phenylobacterium sp. TaxID=1871053 RepID=UPI0025FA7B0E|nr:glycerol-3-phosphate 1-O-acyltransferase PlsY [Phenylobacterium sp.]